MTPNNSSSTRLGIIGFGQVGQAMAKVLTRSHSVTIFDLRTDQCRAHPLVENGDVTLASSSAALVDASDIVILCLPTPEASHAVAAHISGAMRPGLIVMETSTVTPQDVAALDAVLSPGGARVVDTAVIGGIHALSSGQAVFLVGAAQDDSDPISAVLKQLAAEVFYLNRQGGGMRAKLVANAVSHGVYVVLSEAIAVATAQDIPMSVIYRLLARESGLSRPLTHRIGERLFNGNFAGGMSTANARKDSKLFLETAHELKVPVFAIQAAHSVYEIAACEGMAADDYAIVATLWEKWIGRTLRAEEVSP
ncbi:MAG: NAD(P)-dependent oxidoreductase [Ottowia sp.]|uniref:NAD(P)-dependent oxidoreductase n=1 Tax=Ottowia sp. TaxID=1898956 RepID=UPI003C72AB2D